MGRSESDNVGFKLRHILTTGNVASVARNCVSMQEMLFENKASCKTKSIGFEGI